MPWFRLDDSFHSHPKVIAAGNEAIGLYVRCGTYAAQHLTDGFISEAVALQFGSRRLIAVLVEVKLWRAVRGGGWQMRDFLEYNPSKKDVIHKREVRAAAGRKGGLASGKTRSKREANASAVLHHMDEPPIPVPSLVDVVNLTNGGKARASPEVIDSIIKEIHDITGRDIDEAWAQRVADHVLQGRKPANPAAYVRQAIRNDPNPRQRFLPLY